MNLKQIIRKNLNEILVNEGIEDGNPDHKYYGLTGMIIS